jgi:hypothetical protein
MNAIIEKFANAIKEAEAAALAAGQNTEDGGSCNHDQVTIDFTGWNNNNIQKVAELAGIKISEKQTARYFKGCCFIDTTRYGQGSRRTRMAEAAYKSLVGNGIPARMYMQAD